MVTGIGVTKAARRWRAVRTSLSIMHGHVEHGGERLAAADPAGERVGGRHRRGPRRVAQQGDLADDQAGRHLDLDDVAVGAGVGDLGAAGADQQERHGVLALAHQHLAGRGGQRPQLSGQRPQRRVRAAGEELQVGQFLGADGLGSRHARGYGLPVAPGNEQSGKRPIS